MSLSATEILAAGRLIARRAAPYFRACLLSFDARPLPGLGTVVSSARGVFLYDPAFVESLGGGRADLAAQQMAGLWVHECMHRVLLHGPRLGARDPRNWNRAADLAINPAVLDMGCVLPDGENAGLMPEAFGFARGLTVEEYYELLRKLPQEQQVALGAGPPEQDDAGGEASGAGGGGEDADHDQPGGGDEPHAAGGFCGSCAGRPAPGEPEDKGGGQGDGRTDAELERVNRQVARDVQEHASRNRGTVPADLQRWAEGFLEPPRVPWRERLARCVRSAVAYRAGAVDHRWDGPGRRQAGLGYGPGKPVLPRLRQPVPRVAVFADTSGSMGKEEMTDVLRETRGIISAIGGEIEFGACDAEVRSLGKVRRIEDVAALLKGGGGTDFRPVFDLLAQRRQRPEVLIFVTDGCGPAPATAPQWCRTVWVLVGPYKQRPAEWGEVVEVDDKKKDLQE